MYEEQAGLRGKAKQNRGSTLACRLMTASFRTLPEWRAALQKSSMAAFFVAAFAMLPLSTAGAGLTITREQLQADITQAYDLLKKYHPNLTAHISRGELDALYRRLLEEAGEKNTQDEAYLALSELMGSVCDEHTRVVDQFATGTIIPTGWPWYEFPLIVEGGKLYLEDDRGGRKEEVLSIDGIAGSDIAEGLAARSPNDGCLDDGTLIVNERLRIHGTVLGEMIGQKGPYVVRTRNGKAATEVERVVAAADYATSSKDRRRFRQLQNSNVRAELATADFDRVDLGPELPRAGLDYHYSQGRNAAYLNIDSFRFPKNAAKGIELAMRDIIEKNPDVLIIDLVDNPGGMNETAQLVLAFLLPRSHRLYSRGRVRNVERGHPANFEFFNDQAKRARDTNVRYFRKIRPRAGVRSAPARKRSFGKPDYKGRIYVLVSPSSRSNATKVATNLKRLRDATIVGAVTATDTVTNCARANGQFRLRHSDLRLHIPEICYEAPENRFNEEHSLVPDIEVDVLEVPLAELNARTFRSALEDHDTVATN